MSKETGPEYVSSGDRAALLAEIAHVIGEWPGPRIIEALENDMLPPAETLIAGVVNAEEIAPAVLACIDLAATGAKLSGPQHNLLFRGLYLLGGARHTQACPHVLALLRATGNALEDLIGDTDTDGLQRILTGLYDGDAEAFRAAILDSGTGGAARGALLNAITFLTFEERVAADWTQALLEEAERTWNRERNDLAWYEWSYCIETLGLRALLPLVEKAYEDGRIDPVIGTFGEFSEGLAAAEADPGNADRFVLARLGYIEDVVEELERWEPEPATETNWQEPDRRYQLRPSDMPIRNPMRHVGRNDPCPCGSGKKYKKCCLT